MFVRRGDFRDIPGSAGTVGLPENHYTLLTEPALHDWLTEPCQIGQAPPISSSAMDRTIVPAAWRDDHGAAAVMS
ncbi:hypothetical protein ACFORH_07425 [Amycolatopsis roodepoortensis]|uniref:Uncharacterized protein n=1 Tax=Amycolatopsis roodepoortensis TaxID=700274 RepID=A0ABR9L9H9_9PSEU|nr:hypothetical protein [Amycolatopsis roodepoortensis]MBE1576987.1 hypothetical protein [Amycolatopsis roodepoortensis]